MNSPVFGDEVIIWIYDGTWKLYACATSASLNVTTEVIETSVSGNGLWASFAPTKHTFTGTIEGLVSLNNSGVLGLPELRAAQFAQTIFLMQIQRTDKLGNVYTEDGYFFITNSSDTGRFDGVDTFSISLQGTGVLTQAYDNPS